MAPLTYHHYESFCELFRPKAVHWIFGVTPGENGRTERLGRKLKVPTNRITGILNGRRAMTGDTALRLAHFFGTSAEFWLNLEKLYELRLAEQKAGKTIKALPRLKDEHVHT